MTVTTKIYVKNLVTVTVKLTATIKSMSGNVGQALLPLPLWSDHTPSHSLLSSSIFMGLRNCKSVSWPPSQKCQIVNSQYRLQLGRKSLMLSSKIPRLPPSQPFFQLTSNHFSKVGCRRWTNTCSLPSENS